MRRHSDGPSRRWWRRLERKAIAAYEHELLDAVQELAVERVTCHVLAEQATNPAGVLRLALQQQRLSVAGALPAQRELLRAMQSGGVLQLTAAGRYGQLWWIALSNGPTQTVIAGSRMRLTSDDGGGGYGVAHDFREPHLTWL